MKFAFKPSAKAFPGSAILRTIDVECDVESFADVMVSIDGVMVAPAVVAHAASFGLKQRLANSYVSASTAQTDTKPPRLLSQSKREALWQGLFDKMLGKIKSGEAPSWESVWSEGRESVDPFTAEVNRITAAKLRTWAAAKAAKTEGGFKLPKVDSPKYKALHAKMLTAKRAEIEAEARRRLDEIEAIGDVDLDLDDMTDEAGETETTSTESVPE